MNIRLKILAIFILTLVIAVGGGYLYYSLLTDLQQSDEEYIAGVYYPKPVAIPIATQENVFQKKERIKHTNFPIQKMPDLPSESSVREFGVATSGTLSDFGGYSYRKKATESTYSGTGGFAGSMMAYGGGSNSGGDNASGGYSSGGTTMGGTSSLLVPRNNHYKNPPTTGNGIILVDPMTDPKGNPIPVGEGWWMLMLLALGYAPLRLKKKPKPL